MPLQHTKPSGKWAGLIEQAISIPIGESFLFLPLIPDEVLTRTHKSRIWVALYQSRFTYQWEFSIREEAGNLLITKKGVREKSRMIPLTPQPVPAAPPVAKPVSVNVEAIDAQIRRLQWLKEILLDPDMVRLVRSMLLKAS